VQRTQTSLVALLLLGFAVAGTFSLRRDAATFDETAHIVAGLSYLDRNDFRLNSEHPALAKLWAAWPVRVLGRDTVDYGSPAWRETDEWMLGFAALQGDPARVLVPARLAILATGLALGAIVLAWSWELWGAWGGLLSLFLYVTSPTMLAHARYVTTDLPAALGIVATVWLFWRFTRRPSAVRAALCGLAAGAALATKYSAVLLAPMLLVVALPWLCGKEWRSRSTRLLLALPLVALVAGIVVWAAYGFRYAASPDPSYAFDWSALGERPGPSSTLLREARDAHLAPEAWLHGLATVRATSSRREAYLNGQRSVVGWWSYFPEAFLLKSPPALFALLAWGAVFAARRLRSRAFDVWAVLGPVVVYALFSLSARLNIGHRHLAPIEPLLFVLLGCIARSAWSRRAGRIALGALLLSYTASFVAATPRYLSYFNFLAGGPRGAPRYLLDSNLDWGQDLGRLGEWSREHGSPEIYLAYFGTADPRAYGIRFRKVCLVHDMRPDLPEERPGPGDLVAVSVNLLYGLYADEDQALGRTLLARHLVTTSQVRAWIELRDRASRSGDRHPSLAEWVVAQGLIAGPTLEPIRSGLLPAWFSRLRASGEPLARAGDSIYVYRVPADLSQGETVRRDDPSHAISD
jgi:hypothetical protein